MSIQNTLDKIYKDNHFDKKGVTSLDLLIDDACNINDHNYGKLLVLIQAIDVYRGLQVTHREIENELINKVLKSIIKGLI